MSSNNTNASTNSNYPVATLPQDTFHRMLRMYSNLGWRITRNHMAKVGYSHDAIATVLIAALWHGASTPL